MSSELISGITQATQAQTGGRQNLGTQQNSQPGRSFESVLEGGGQTQSAEGGRRTSGAQIEQLRLDLMQRIEKLPPGASKNSLLLPELLDTRTRMGLLKEVMNNKTPSAGTNLQGRFGQVENEWKAVEQIMKSDKDLSTGELLGLQARLYQVSQHIEVMSKVVDQVTGGVKTILNTNI